MLLKAGIEKVLQVLTAIKENLPLREVPLRSRQDVFISATSLEKLFQERFPQALDNLESLFQVFLMTWILV